MKFFEVFKVGKYPQGNYTDKELNQIAENYDPKFCEAPVTIDHIQTGPAYGWVDKVKTENGTLKVSFKDMPEQMKKDVNDGRFKKVSVEIYKNLEGKGCYLKAVSFLGAAIPQVKGLEAIKFKDSEADFFEFDAVIEDNSETYAQEDVEALKNQISDLEKQISAFKENNKRTETIKSLKLKIDELNKEINIFKEKADGKEEIEKELEYIKKTIKDNEHETFVDKQIEKGILIPNNKKLIISVLQTLDNVQKFKEESDVAVDFKAFIESLPKQIEFNEIATKQNYSNSDNSSDKFANADEESLEIFNEAKALSVKENISFKDALLKLNI